MLVHEFKLGKVMCEVGVATFSKAGVVITGVTAKGESISKTFDLDDIVSALLSQKSLKDSILEVATAQVEVVETVAADSFAMIADAPVLTEQPAKRRGRPAGSKNKPKTETA